MLVCTCVACVLFTSLVLQHCLTVCGVYKIRDDTVSAAVQGFRFRFGLFMFIALSARTLLLHGNVDGDYFFSWMRKHDNGLSNLTYEYIDYDIYFKSIKQKELVLILHNPSKIKQIFGFF